MDITSSAIIWWTTNIILAGSYFAIPFELKKWKKALNSPLSDTLLFLSNMFIFTCGLTHLGMLAVMMDAPLWLSIGIYLPAALTSFVTASVIYWYRDRILNLMTPKEE